MPSPATYSRLMIGLHWLIALLIAGAWFTQEQMEKRGPEATGLRIAGLPVHIWLGLAVLALVLVRIAVRRVQGTPDRADAMHSGLQRVSIWGHRLLYALMVLVPLAGMARAFLKIEAAGDMHETLATLLVLVALGHAAAAIFHQYVLKDGTLQRMTRLRAINR